MHKEFLEKHLIPKRKPIEGGSKDKYPVRHTEELYQQPGTRLES